MHLVDGTYELFRYHYAPNNKDERQGATRGVLASLLNLVEGGATHIGVATDHVIESWRNDLWPGYKTGDGVDPALKAQFPLLEEACAAAGFAVWPQVEHEADDGLASAARVAASDDRVEKVVICTPDKDLAQCVGGRVVQWDRRQDRWFDAAAVRDKFGVRPGSIPDYLAVVGDSADGFPGLAGWGAKSAAAVLSRYEHLEAVPAASSDWEVGVRNAGKLAATLQAHMADALLFRRLATLDTDAPVSASVDEIGWTGPTEVFRAICAELGDEDLGARSEQLAAELADTR